MTKKIEIVTDKQKARAFDALVEMLRHTGKYVRTERRFTPLPESIEDFDPMSIGATDYRVTKYAIEVVSNDPLEVSLLRLGEDK